MVLRESIRAGISFYVRGLTVALAVLISGCVISSRDAAPIDAKLVHGDAPMVVAHRGCWQEAPENSLAAIEACVDLGVDIVELDIRQTSDDVLVLMHDVSVDRTTNGTGAVSELSYAEIRGLQLKSGAGGSSATLTDHTVPTFEQAMKLARDRILVNVDAKSDVFEGVMQTLQRLRLLDHVVMKLELPSDDLRLQNAPFLGNTHFMPKITQKDTTLSKSAPEYEWTKPVAFELKFETEDYLVEGRSTIENMGARIWVNTLEPHKCAYHDDQRALEDPDAHWGRLLGLGVSMIQTDYPAKLLEYIEGR